MGLSISKRLVALMQGNMWVESEVKRGSKFFFTITSSISHQTMESVQQKMKPFEGRCILFVNVNPELTDIADFIREFGLVPRVIQDVQEVKVKENNPHFETIVIDDPSVVSDLDLDLLGLPLTVALD